MMNPWPVARAALCRRPFIAIALAALVAVAVALGVAIGALERGLRAGSAQAAAGFDLVVGAPGSPTQLILATVFLRPEAIPLLPGETLAALAREPGVAWVSPIGFGDSWRGHPIVGVTVDFVTRGGQRALAAGHGFAGPWEAVVGARVPLRPGERLTPGHGRHLHEDEEEGGHAESHYTVTGVLPAEGTVWDQAILVPIESVWELHGLGNGHGEEEELTGPPWIAPPGVPAVAVRPVGVADAYRLRGKYRTDGSLAVFPAEVLVPLLRSLGDVRGLLAGLAWVAFGLVLAAVFLAFSAGFLARRREFAVLRAIGAPPRYVVAAAWLEAAAVVGGGVLLGLPLGWLAAFVLGQWAGTELAFAVPVGPDWRDLAAPALALAAGLLAALLPASLLGRRPLEADLRS